MQPMRLTVTCRLISLVESPQRLRYSSALMSWTFTCGTTKAINGTGSTAIAESSVPSEPEQWAPV